MYQITAASFTKDYQFFHDKSISLSRISAWRFYERLQHFILILQCWKRIIGNFIEIHHGRIKTNIYQLLQLNYK